MQLFVRQAEISMVFAQYGRTDPIKGWMRNVKTKENEWSPDLIKSVEVMIVNAIKKRDSVDFVKYGTFAMDNAKTEAEKNRISELTNAIVKKRNEILEERYDELIPLQEEYWNNKEKLESLSPAANTKINLELKEIENILDGMTI